MSFVNFQAALKAFQQQCQTHLKAMINTEPRISAPNKGVLRGEINPSVVQMGNVANQFKGRYPTNKQQVAIEAVNKIATMCHDAQTNARKRINQLKT